MITKQTALLVLCVCWIMVWPPSLLVAGSQASEVSFVSNVAPRAGTAMPAVVRLASQRTSAAHIGSVMAILATFDEAKVLPREQDPKANQLIHTLIQLQSMVLKSQNPVIREWVLSALRVKSGNSVEQVQKDLQRTGLTMESLEAFVEYSEMSSPWSRGDLSDGFHEYNVRQEHWMLLQKILVAAREQLQVRGATLAEVFARQRLHMPGAIQ